MVVTAYRPQIQRRAIKALKTPFMAFEPTKSRHARLLVFWVT